MGTTDPLAALLDAATPRRGGHKFRVDGLFSNRPDVLAMIVKASQSGVSADQIAELLSTEGETISGSAVEGWLKVRTRAV